MGCDIHTFIEAKVNGHWHFAGSHDRFSRNYRVFAELAGVRGDPASGKPVAPDRGLPDDVSFWVKLESDRYGEDGHSHSWASWQEVAELADRCSAFEPYVVSQFGYLCGNHVDDEDEWREQGIEDVRVVFWFDN
jgi:hypothetical protein